MASRPVFVISEMGIPIVKQIEISFNWNPGFAPSQKKKNIINLHKEAEKQGMGNVLEVSTKSEDELGKMLSAFNLKANFGTYYTNVENFYQSSKVFENGGPYLDLLNVSAKEAKQDSRLNNSGDLKEFLFFETKWALSPKTAFYDWLYISALAQNKGLHDDLLNFHAFSDIEYNPNRSVNCQARSVAMFVSLKKRCLIENFLTNKSTFLELYANSGNEFQLGLF